MTDPYPIKNIYWNAGGFTGVAYYIGIIQRLLNEERTGNTRIDFANLLHFGASAGNGSMLAYELMRGDTLERQRELCNLWYDYVGLMFDGNSNINRSRRGRMRLQSWVA